MAKERRTKTKYEIIQVASKFFLEQSYTNTSVHTIAKELGISPGNLTYHFPTKEHLLLGVTEKMVDFKERKYQKEAGLGIESISSICLDFMTVVSGCQESPRAKDLFIAIYSSEMCRNHFQKRRIERAKRILSEQCAGWTENQFKFVELMITGIYLSTITTSDDYLPLETRLPEALYLILDIYGVDEATRRNEIAKILQLDYRQIGKNYYKEFIDYVEEINDKILEEMSDN
ncbi:MAG: TetR/AcrR family transcriptional regulator [Lachnospiraceae bacterium]|nr:TetR/AcrR family transcriptional regulator [Lachnospiraceae bacterium]